MFVIPSFIRFAFAFCSPSLWLGRIDIRKISISSQQSRFGGHEMSRHVEFSRLAEVSVLPSTQHRTRQLWKEQYQ